MKENDEVMQGSQSGVVLSVLKDTKKLNAGIAFLALQSLDDRDGISDKYIPAITALAERAVITPLYKPGPTDDEIIQQCMIAIEEYLKEQGV